MNIELTAKSDKQSAQAEAVKQAITGHVAKSKAAAEEADSADKAEANHQRETLAATLLATQSGAPAGDLQQALLAELLAGMKADRDEKARVKQEALDEWNRMRLAQVENLKATRSREVLTQQVCDHKKPPPVNGTRLCGQRLSNGHMAYLCNLCYKIWDESNVPAHLMPNSEFMGG
jgi:hypothetical protein